MAVNYNINGIVQQVGPIVQLAFVPKDFDAALKYWTTVMGVGPFFLLEHLPLVDVRYRGMPSNVDMSAALAYWGDMQIELIVQHNDEPSTYHDWLKGGNEGLHHVGVNVDNMQSARSLMERSGAIIVHEAFMPGAAEATYYEMSGPAPIVELIKMDPKFQSLFAFMKRAAADWDGSDPVRSIPAECEW